MQIKYILKRKQPKKTRKKVSEIAGYVRMYRYGQKHIAICIAGLLNRGLPVYW